MAMKKTIAEDDNEYSQQRARNNISVRKSRAKSKLRIQRTAERISNLRNENETLSKEMTQLSKELTILKHLVTVFIHTKWWMKKSLWLSNQLLWRNWKWEIPNGRGSVENFPFPQGQREMEKPNAQECLEGKMN